MSFADSAFGSQSPGFGSSPKKQCTRPDKVPINYHGKPVVPYTHGQAFNYAEHEALPKLASNHPSVKAIEELNAKSIQMIMDVIHAFKGKDTEIRGLCAEFDGKKAIDYGKRITIGVSGDSGAGKSTFINTMLGELLLVRPGSSGACTQVPQEIIDDPEMVYNCSSEVQFTPMESIFSDIERHFTFYYRHKALADTEEASEDDFNGQWKDSKPSDVETRYQTAEEYFLALFGNLPEFESPEALEETLMAATSDRDEHILSMLKRCVEDLWNKLPLEHGSRSITISANTLDDLRWQLAPYIEVNHSGEGRGAALWPIVALVRTRINSPLLRQGFSIADCPGVSDANLDRLANTEAYLDRCSIIVVMHDISRIIDDLSIRRLVARYIRTKGAPNVIILATKADMIAQDPSGCSQAEAETMRLLQEAVSAAEMRQADVQRNLAQAVREEDTQLILQLNRATAQTATAKSKLQRHRILVRNDMTKKRLQAKFKDLTKHGEPLHIIPVASTEHQTYMKGGFHGEPALLLGEDGYREIRQLLCARAQEGRAETLERHVFVAVECSINRLNMLLNKQRFERKGSIVTILRRGVERSTLELPAYQRKLIDCFAQEVAGAIKKSVGSEKNNWTIKLKGLIQFWAQEYKAPASLKAFCKHYGIHKPKNSKLCINWNQQILLHVVPDLKDFEKQMSKEFDRIKGKVKSEVKAVFNEISGDLRNNENFGGVDMSHFWKQFAIRESELDYDLRNLMSDLCIAVLDIDTRAFSDDQDTPFNEAMNKIYPRVHHGTEATPRKGAKTLQRYQFLHAKITSSYPNGPFILMANDMAAQFLEVVKQWRPKLDKTLEKPFKLLLEDLDLMFTGETLTEDERSSVRVDLRFVMPHVKEIRSQIDEHMQKVKACLKPEFESEPSVDRTHRDNGPRVVIHRPSAPNFT